MIRTTLLVLLALVLATAGAIGTLVWTGKIHLPFLGADTSEKDVLPAGAIRVPVTGQHVSALTPLSRENLVSPATGQVVQFVLPATAVQKQGFITDVGQLVGRVLRVDKEPGHAFTDADFYPAGTMPGEAAAVPPGKRAVTFDVSKTAGVRGLLAGDRVDLIAAQAIEPPKAGPTFGGSLLNKGLIPQNAPMKRATVRVLARDAVVVAPLKRREVPYMTIGSLTSSPQTKTRPVEEITIAVDVEEVPPIAAAMALDETITCVAHSGQPAAGNGEKALPADAHQADDTQPTVTTIERIVGSKHDLVVIPANGNPTIPDPAVNAEGSPR